MSIITKYVSFEDIDLANKLENMLYSEISEEIYEKCLEEKVFHKIEDKIWKLMRNSASKFSRTKFYEGLADEYEATDKKDRLSACVYNCDILYITAIAHVLGLEIPKTSSDISIFGIVI